MRQPKHAKIRVFRQQSNASRYFFLFAGRQKVPNLRVDTELWDRIANGLPRGFEWPDRPLMDWLAQRAQERREAERHLNEGGGGGDD